MTSHSAFVGKTDYEWFTFLRRQAGLDEVNFWRPSGRGFGAIPPQSPYLFELKAPHRVIGGFGFFTRFERLPMWLAWDTFGLANGTDSLPSLIKIIGGHRSSGSTNDRTDIGCIMVRDAIFFADNDFIPLPRGWPVNVQVGKLLDIAGDEEGRRIWSKCLDRAIARRLPDASGTIDQRRRYAEDRLCRQRLGQGSFRIEVSKAYDWACAVTHEHSRPTLEAAHIKPFALEGPHDVSNGLLLRSDIHRLFDRGYVTVTPEHRFLVSDALKRDFENGKSYYPHNDTSIAVPKNPTLLPSPDLLAWHNQNVFRR